MYNCKAKEVLDFGSSLELSDPYASQKGAWSSLLQVQEVGWVEEDV
jgi:hypothetical protein